MNIPGKGRVWHLTAKVGPVIMKIKRLFKRSPLTGAAKTQESIMSQTVTRVRRAGEVISEVRPDLPPKPKGRTVKVKARSYSRVSMADKRAAIPYATRKQLSAVQWAELGDNLRVLNRYSYVNADALSLAESREAILSIQRCSLLRFMAQA